MDSVAAVIIIHYIKCACVCYAACDVMRYIDSSTQSAVVYRHTVGLVQLSSGLAGLATALEQWKYATVRLKPFTRS